MEQLIKLILEKYPIARATIDFAGKHQVHDLFQKLRNEISNLDFIKNNPNLIVKSSYGKDNWAAVPWLAILDSRETDTTQSKSSITGSVSRKD